MKSYKIVTTTLLFFLTLGSVSFAQSDKKESKQNEKKTEKPDMKEEADFAIKAADAEMFEVQVAELAKTNASSEKVKDLAKQMLANHSKANDELKMIAAKRKIVLPAKLNDQNQKEFDELKNLKGADFDKEYTKELVRYHKEAVALFQKESDKVKTEDLKAWAAGKLKVLKHHLSLAESTYEMVK